MGFEPVEPERADEPGPAKATVYPRLIYLSADVVSEYLPDAERVQVGVNEADHRLRIKPTEDGGFALSGDGGRRIGCGAAIKRVTQGGLPDDDSFEADLLEDQDGNLILDCSDWVEAKSDG